MDETIKLIDDVVAALTKLRGHLAATDPEAEFLRLQALLKSPEWPEAVDPFLICDETSPADVAERAAAILNQVVPVPLAGKRFLDFGCGNGSVAALAGDQAASAVGYDLRDGWGAAGRATLTTDWAAVEAAGPYDIILLYDVLDHLDVDPQVVVLGRVKSVLAPGGTVYVQTHPWTAPHGAHVYKALNKAFTHIVFTADELASLGLSGAKTERLIHPLAAYRGWFAAVGLTVNQELPIRRPVHDFFKTQPVVERRIKAAYVRSKEKDLASGKAFPEAQLSLEYVRYILSA